MSAEPIYLDHNATTPLDPRVLAAMAECYQRWPANPASQHRAGQAARRVLEGARDEIARLLGARTDSRPPDQVIFTSGATEANNLAVRGLMGRPPGELVISAIEHPSIAAVADALADEGFVVRRLGVDRRGVARLDQLPALLNDQTRLVCLMLGNNETGALQPVAEAAAICRAAAVALHCDAVQAAGKLPLDFHALGATTLSISAHKFHGPRGIGALLVRGGTRLAPMLHGGEQQGGLRPGSETVALPLGMATALRCWHEQSAERLRRMTELRDRFESLLLQGAGEVIIHSADAPRLPHTSHVAFAQLDRQELLLALDLAGVACSAGSSCASGSSEPSAVLLAMGVSKPLAAGSLRFSLGAFTTPWEVAEASRRILSICNNLRRQKQPGKSPAPAPAAESEPV